MAAMQGVAVSVRAADVPTLRPVDRILGNKNAPITIFEYASLTCPHCAAFASDTLPKLKKDWIDAGKAKLVYRDYPLDQSAALAATIARCFPEDRYFPFLETLFADQHEWVQHDAAATKAALMRLAGLGGMSERDFNVCAANQKKLRRRAEFAARGPEPLRHQMDADVLHQRHQGRGRPAV
ncbi:MAG: thioredoxin domain-containing protein [Alphaproteobacteria bacterium]|nr:thioredoxin domain-containing protein [Alphaproteobacteria bacterium]